ncbi:MAG: tyrosine-type recombinase/integrase [bacterium]|nr:tyrosine-type recombinase/integrase [bacterium]
MARECTSPWERLRSIKPGLSTTYYLDDETRGLELCVTATGAKAFYLYRRVQGRPRHLFIGRFPETKLAQAKVTCEEWNPLISRREDPTITRERSGLTLGRMFEIYLERHAKPHNKTWREDENQFERYLKPWKNRLIVDISKSDVAGLHVKIGQKHGQYAANRALALLSSIFNKASAWDLFTGNNPVKGIQKFREKSRERFLNADELHRLFAALKSTDKLFEDYFLLCLYTGARCGNVREMRWCDVDLESACWSIPETKSGRPLLVPLIPAAIELLQVRQSFVSGEWVFQGRFPGTHLQEPKSAWKRICDKACLDNVRIHDLRRTLGSWMASRGEGSPDRSNPWPFVPDIHNGL